MKKKVMYHDYYEKDANIKAAVDFIISEDLVKVGDKERLKRLHKELISKDWFMTLIEKRLNTSTRKKKYTQLTKIMMHGTKKLFTTLLEAGFFSSDVQSNSKTKTSIFKNNILVA